MKTESTVAIATPAAVTVRRFEVLNGLWHEQKNGVLALNKGAEMNPSEFGFYIAENVRIGSEAYNKARFAYYQAGKLPAGKEVQKEIVAILGQSMSAGAISQLTSEANTLCPLIAEHGIKTPLSLLKDAVKALELDDKTGAPLPLEKQSTAGKLLLPRLMGEGEKLTQAAIRTIRAEIPTTEGGTKRLPRPGQSPVITKSEDDKAKDEAKAFGAFLASMQAAEQYLAGHKLTGDDKKKADTIATGICRHLGISAK